jgi:hypothetical protein
MVPSDAPLPAALEPVRAALLRAARADADAVEAAAGRDGELTVREATIRAGHLREQARADGAADAAAALAVLRARAGRAARATVLAARREEYEALRAAARAAMAALARDPTVHMRLIATARVRLGPEATVEEAPGGGVVASAGARRLDLSLAGFADRAVDQVADRLDAP